MTAVVFTALRAVSAKLHRRDVIPITIDSDCESPHTNAPSPRPHPECNEEEVEGPALKIGRPLPVTVSSRESARLLQRTEGSAVAFASPGTFSCSWVAQEPCSTAASPQELQLALIPSSGQLAQNGAAANTTLRPLMASESTRRRSPAS